MAITRTCTYVNTNEKPYDSLNDDIIYALDSVLTARFNSGSWLAYSAAPQLQTGDQFQFGTPYNLQSLGTQYDTSQENPPNPTVGQVVSIDGETNVIWLTGYSAYNTLNRKQVTYTGSRLWVGYNGAEAEQFERLSIADIAVEDYTDPIAGTNTTFTYMDHWDKYGSVRIHNGNQFPLTIDIASSSIVIPPYGITCFRRIHQTGSWSNGTRYLPENAQGDRLTFQCNENTNGQVAGNLEQSYLILKNPSWIRFNAEMDYDTTSREQPIFTGATPQSTDYFFDWICHKGTFLSVVLNRDTQVVNIVELTWNGLDSGFSPSGIVNHSISAFGTLTLSSAIVSGTNFNHDLIPVSSNLTSGKIYDVKGGGAVIPLPYLDFWKHLQNPIYFGGIQTSNGVTFAPNSPLTQSSYTIFEYGYDILGQFLPNRWDSTLIGSFPDVTDVADIEEEGYTKANGAIGRYKTISINGSNYSASQFPSSLLDTLYVSSGKPVWTFGNHFGITGRQRFTGWAKRKYQTGSIASLGGVDTMVLHPQETNQQYQGTTDKSASYADMIYQPRLSSSLSLELGDYQRYRSVWGMDVYMSVNNLHVILDNIYKDGWWTTTERDRRVAGYYPSSEKVAWRLPRLIENYNDLAKAINNIQEVKTCDARDLYRNPMPNVFQKPFSLYGQTPHAVPADYLCGGYDIGNAIKNWANTWGIPYYTVLPDMGTLESIERIVWARTLAERSTTGSLPWGWTLSGYIKVPKSTVDSTPYGSTANGKNYPRYSAWQPNYANFVFGGNGSTNGYVWVKHSEADSVFGALNVKIPSVPGGTRFDPTYSEDGDINVIVGQYYATGIGMIEEDLAGVLSPPFNDAYTFYRNPNTTGTWIYTADDYETFRLCDFTAATQNSKSIYDSQENTSSTEWIVHTIEENSNALLYGYFSPYNLSPMNAFHFTTYMFNFPEPLKFAYPTLTEYYATDPVLISFAPEPYYTIELQSVSNPPSPDDVFEDPNTYSNFIQNIPATSTLSFKEVSTSDMPITVDKLNTWSGLSEKSYHCQLVRRTGVLRQ